MSLSIKIQENGIEINFLNSKDSLSLIKSPKAQEILLLNQIHGSKVVPQNRVGETKIADGHSTENVALKLGIKTADCLPIIVFDSKNKRISAVHAGWKGVALNIASNSIRQLLSYGTQSNDLKVWIGPHIQFESFEIESAALSEILSSIENLKFDRNEVYKQTSDTKFILNLKKVVEIQLQSFSISREKIWSSDIDTKTNSDWASYRRDKTTLRNLSWVELLP